MNKLTFVPKLHFQETSGTFAGAWRPTSAKVFGAKDQIAEAKRIREENGVVVPPDLFASKPELQEKFNALATILDMGKSGKAASNEADSATDEGEAQ